MAIGAAPAAAAELRPSSLRHELKKNSQPLLPVRTSVTSGPNTMPTPRASLVRKPGSATCSQAGSISLQTSCLDGC